MHGRVGHREQRVGGEGAPLGRKLERAHGAGAVEGGQRLASDPRTEHLTIEHGPDHAGTVHVERHQDQTGRRQAQHGPHDSGAGQDEGAVGLALGGQRLGAEGDGARHRAVGQAREQRPDPGGIGLAGRGRRQGREGR